MIYLDHAATTRADGRVIDEMARCMREAWANPSAAYGAAGMARRELRRARTALAALLNAAPQEVLFTSGGTEGNNQAVALAAGGHAVVSAIEHASVLNAARALCREVTLVPPDATGRVDPEAVARALRPDTKLVAAQLANNETGVLQPAAEIGALARARRVPYLCDAVQAFGRVPVDVKAIKADLLTLSGHKLYGPRGVGALYVRQGVALPPLLRGGGQELGYRAGTENLPAVCGLRVAAELAAAGMADEADRERALLDAFLADLRARVPGCSVLGAGAERLPGVAALLLPNLTSEAAIAKLDLLGVQVSGGAACASHDHAPSHVYRAMGLPEGDAARVVRVSIGRDTTEKDLRDAAEAFGRVYGEANYNLNTATP